MNGGTRIWFLSAFFFIPLFAQKQYECGVHGKFEYCIDGIPGCVIGCHCHPGYYFDTDTKICEPNLKLTQDYRRHYLSEPTRVQISSITPLPNKLTTTSNAVDEKIDEIAKDADDLGDWLYNQFFKTIENQVINKTQGEELPPTRRNGKILLKKPTRKSGKHWKGKKKKKRKSKSFKNKLLRITEDDSLFDSDSGYTSNEETASSSESETSDSVNEKLPTNKNHGHKKIIIFNKRPSPPLPSFIFLPNMETPFYPPLGLPPPPVMPMYPMVPVPPMLPGPQMGPPLFPFPGSPHDNCDSTSPPSTSPANMDSTVSTDTTIMTASTGSTASSSSTASTSSEVSTSSTASTSPLEMLRRRRKKKKQEISRSSNQAIPVDPMTRDQRNKLFNKLREKLNRKNKLENFFVDQYQAQESPMLIDVPSDLVQNRHLMNMNVASPSPEDVKFKYLAELIHKADGNKTMNSNLNPNKLTNDMSGIESVQPPQSRRNYYPLREENNVIRQRSRMDVISDPFYTNLGKQIAALIRNVDSRGEHQVDIEIEGTNSKLNSHTSPIFNENQYASRSYFERSVRSPLKHLEQELDHLKKSNEDLYSLENKVELAASNARSLSLHDLENIISKVQKAQLKPKRISFYVHKNNPSNVSLKLNLLPGNIETIQPLSKPRRMQNLNKHSDFINHSNTRAKQLMPKLNRVESFKDIIYKPSRRSSLYKDEYKSNGSSEQSDAKNVMINNFQRKSPDLYDPLAIIETGQTQSRNMKPTRMPNAIPQVQSAPQITKIIPSIKKSATMINLKQQPSPRPVEINQKQVNYHTQNANSYLFDEVMPIQYTSGLTRSLVPYGKFDKPSYFYHGFQHFDYFDEQK